MEYEKHMGTRWPPEEQRVVVEPMEDLEEISLDDNTSGRIACISMQADPSVYKELAIFLKKN